MTRTIQTLFYNYWPPEKPLFAAMVLWDKVFKSGLSEFCELGLGLGCLPKNLLNQLLNTLYNRRRKKAILQQCNGVKCFNNVYT